ncbi:MAG: hypothetical protein HeimC2_08530 [Candidatus Heimdallarchaeota archaeon LC_2]|nr:MAG: hypothetical protein HeimC2_08530 [Candidatus Heimdallarchaeota archaeon LC_2]
MSQQEDTINSSEYNDEFDDFLTEIQKKNLRYAKYAFILAVMNYIIALFSPQIILLGESLVRLHLLDIYSLAPDAGRRLFILELMSIIFTTFNISIYHFNRPLQFEKVRLNSTIAIGSASFAAIEILKFNTLSLNTIFSLEYVDYVSKLGLAFYALIFANFFVLAGIWTDKFLRMPKNK